MANLKVFILTMVWISNNVLACPASPDLARQGAVSSYPLFIEGIKNIVNSSDPLAIDNVIAGNLPEVKYQLKNTKVTGLKKCVLTALNINKKTSKFKYDLDCPYFEAAGDYNLIGYINDQFTQGEGNFRVKCDNYIFKFNGHFEKYAGKDTKSHARITNYFLDVNAGKVVFDFQNIVSGDKKKSDQFNKYMNDNWEAMDKSLRSPAINTIMDVFISNLNDFLSVVPVEEVFPDMKC